MVLGVRVTFISILFNIILLHKSNPQNLNFHFHQDDYSVNPERLEIVNYNKKYVKSMNAATFKYNRTTSAFNVSMILRNDMGYDDVQVVFQAYKLASNEYRLFPLRFQTSMCNIYDQDIVGIKSFKRNRTEIQCPLQKNKHYYYCNFTPDTSKLPPLIPNGSYRVDLQGYYKHESEEVYKIAAYGSISRPFKGK